MFLTRGSESSSFTMFMNRIHNLHVNYGVNIIIYEKNNSTYPVDMRVISDRNVLRIYKNYFEILVGCILVNPIGVQNAKITANSSCSFLSHTS